MKTSQRLSGPYILLILIFVGILLAGLIVSGWWLVSRTSAGPSITILQPATPQIIESGTGISVIAQAESPYGIQQVDFLVDGELENLQFFEHAGENSQVVVFPWFGNTTGVHTLEVVAHDQDGKSSEAASIQIGVQARDIAQIPTADVVWIPPEAGEEGIGQLIPGDGSAEPIWGGDGSGSADEAGQEGAQPADGVGDNAQAPANEEAGAGGEDALEAMPEQPEDAPPTVTFFDAVPRRNGGAISAVISAEIVDDLGVAYLIVIAHRDGGQPQTFTVTCPGATQCNFREEQVLTPGTWRFALQAFDTSGQASSTHYASVDVIESEDGRAVIADHDADNAQFVGWLGDLFAEGGASFDFANLPALLGELVNRPLEGGREMEANGDDCVTLTVEPSADGNLATLDVHCALAAPEGQIIVVTMSKYLMRTGDPGISLFGFWPDIDSNRNTLGPNETFIHLDQNVSCGVAYSYRANIHRGQRDGGGLPGISGTLAVSRLLEVQMPPCPPGSTGDLNLRANALPEGMQVRWAFAPGMNWPADLPPEGVQFALTRYQTATDAHEQIFDGTVSRDVLLGQGQEFSWVDPAPTCGNEYWYTLSVIAANADLGLVNPGWLAHAQAQAPLFPCDSSSVGSIPLSFITGYVYDYNNGRTIQRHAEAVFPHFEIPAGFNWPVGEEIVINLREGHQAPLPAAQIQITPDVMQNGFVYDGERRTSCYTLAYNFHLELEVDGVVVDSGPDFSVAAPPCVPRAPALIRLIGSTDCGAMPHCVRVEWEAAQQPLTDSVLPLSRIGLERYIPNTDQNELRFWDFPIDQTQFLDTSILCSRNSTKYYIYRMVGIAQPRIIGQTSVLIRIMVPKCGQPFDVIEEGR